MASSCGLSPPRSVSTTKTRLGVRAQRVLSHQQSGVARQAPSTRSLRACSSVGCDRDLDRGWSQGLVGRQASPRGYGGHGKLGGVTSADRGHHAEGSDAPCPCGGSLCPAKAGVHRRVRVRSLVPPSQCWRFALATRVTLTLLDFPVGSMRALPDDVELPPLASTALFVIRGAWGDPVAGDVTVECDQLAEPVRVPLPPRG